jgi:hypothetical protein
MMSYVKELERLELGLTIFFWVMISISVVQVILAVLSILSVF